MPQEDKIKREIDRIGLVLAKLLSDMLNRRFETDSETDHVIQAMKSELDLDLNGILEMSYVAAIRYLTVDKKYSLDQLRVLARLLDQCATVSAEGQRLRNLALEIYKHISANGNGVAYLDVELRIRK